MTETRSLCSACGHLCPDSNFFCPQCKEVRPFRFIACLGCSLIFLVLAGAGIINILTEYSSGYTRQGKFVESFGLSAIAHGILLISSGTLFLAVGWKGKFGFATGLFALAGILLSFAVLYMSKHHA